MSKKRKVKKQKRVNQALLNMLPRTKDGLFSYDTVIAAFELGDRIGEARTIEMYIDMIPFLAASWELQTRLSEICICALKMRGDNLRSALEGKIQALASLYGELLETNSNFIRKTSARDLDSIPLKELGGIVGSFIDALELLKLGKEANGDDGEKLREIAYNWNPENLADFRKHIEVMNQKKGERKNKPDRKFIADQARVIMAEYPDLTRMGIAMKITALDTAGLGVEQRLAIDKLKASPTKEQYLYDCLTDYPR